MSFLQSASDSCASIFTDSAFTDTEKFVDTGSENQSQDLKNIDEKQYTTDSKQWVVVNDEKQFLFFSSSYDFVRSNIIVQNIEEYGVAQLFIPESELIEDAALRIALNPYSFDEQVSFTPFNNNLLAQNIEKYEVAQLFITPPQDVSIEDAALRIAFNPYSFESEVNFTPFNNNLLAQNIEEYEVAQLLIPESAIALNPSFSLGSLALNTTENQSRNWQNADEYSFFQEKLFAQSDLLAEDRLIPFERQPDPRTLPVEPLQDEPPELEEEPPDTITVPPEVVAEFIDKALSGTATKYPWIVGGSDSLTFSPFIFKPRIDDMYLNLDLRESDRNPFWNKFGFGYYPYKDQLYWVLEDNTIVGSVAGILAGSIYEGKQTEITQRQVLTQRQSFTGYQAVWVIPNDLQRLFKVQDLSDFQVFSLAGEVVNPEGVPAGDIQFNTDNLGAVGKDTIILPSPQALNDSQIGVGSTFNPQGGGALFRNLDVENSPLILQGFPTNDLRALAEVDVRQGETIPKEILEGAGIYWTNPITGESAPIFNREVTSTPGVKIAQDGKFDNQDLLNILVNPFLTQKERNNHYWNSLFWLGMGIQPPEINTFEIANDQKDWYRFYFSGLHNRFLLQYSQEDIGAVFYNLFTNPGLSVTLSDDFNSVDETQSINASIGMMLGAIFHTLDLHILDESLEKARERRDNNEIFKPITTKATSEQRRDINVRLNSTLGYGNSASSLNQVSGFITFPTYVTPDESDIFQIRTGNIKRAVQFIQQDIGDWTEGETFVESARLSNEDFGPLTFLGNPTPLQATEFENRGQPINENFASQVVLISPEGQKFVQEFNSRYLTTYPVPITTFDLAYDRLVLRRDFTRDINLKYFNGYINLPTIEGLYAGTSGDWAYSANTGIWFNVDPNSAGDISRNDFGLKEPSVGIYVNALTTANFSSPEFDENNILKAISTHSPLFRFSWNSASSGNNPWQITLAYTYSRQTRTYGTSVTGALGIIPQYGNGSVVGFLNGRFSFNNGPILKGNLELGNTVYFGLEATQKVTDNILIGPYVRNYIDLNQGFNSREEELSYGGVIDYQMPDSRASMRLELGVTENGDFIGSLKGDLRF
ncbi:hypothetical protein [Cyanobacterium aponinum]|uniref:Uncharacterized protein n=1 Tax=Cyanobacterium aponinum 0216 TaxID=2676140 RepID=A0A844GSV9_9CHRO|nr:hypothetical protein [Cyanobacterium aponinum]MTF37999.1 hypothetical protein [Cyanobacterium aponinum 0216]